VNSSRFTGYGIVQPAPHLRERRNKRQDRRSGPQHHSAPNVDRPDLGSKPLYQGVSVAHPGLER
jgi:hypothetical protein